MSVRYQTFQFRRGTAAEWSARNPTLLAGEAGYETDTNRLKFGDGVRAWSALSYVGDLEGSVLSGLSDVALSGLADGDVLRYSSGAWRNSPESNLVDGGNF